MGREGPQLALDCGSAGVLARAALLPGGRGVAVLTFRDMARRQRGLVEGGSEGQALIAEADAALAARGVVNPEWFTHAHLTGVRSKG
jgi:hypothetical protein